MHEPTRVPNHSSSAFSIKFPKHESNEDTAGRRKHVEKNKLSPMVVGDGIGGVRLVVWGFSIKSCTELNIARTRDVCESFHSLSLS